MNEDMKQHDCSPSPCSCKFWENLERKYSVVVEENVATASIHGTRFAVITAVLGTKSAEVRLEAGNPIQHVLQTRVSVPETFTPANLTTQLRETCLFVLADWEIALANN